MIEELLINALHQFWDVFLLLSPFLLLGLIFAGLLHLLVSKNQIFKVAGDPGMKGVLLAAALGTPLPFCSCGIAPISVELKRKKASPPAIMSFLISTPETGADTILVTWALLGPIMAGFRLIAAYIMAIFGGFLAIGLIRDVHWPKESLNTCDIACEHDHAHNNLTHKDEEDEPDYVGFSGLYRSLKQYREKWYNRWKNNRFFYSWYRPEESLPKPSDELLQTDQKNTLPLKEIFRRLYNYSFVELADDILPSLILGLVLTFLIFLFFPFNLEKYGMGKGVLPYLVMLAAGVPLYMCASASTPIAAALVYKGLNPGAALVFLLTGPATNLPTLAILMRHFGKRFVTVYLSSVIIMGLLAGIAFDYMLEFLHIHIKSNISMSHDVILGIIQWASALVLILLILYRFYSHPKSYFAGSFAILKDFCAKCAGLPNSLPWRNYISPKSRLMQYGIPLILLAYLATGLSIVPIGGVGYVRVFGHVVRKDLQPGLHYIPPKPFSQMDIFYPLSPRRVSVGFASTENGQTSPNKGRHDVEFFTGDLNLADIVVSIEYFVTDPFRYFYQIKDPEELIADYLSKSTKNAAAQGPIIEMMTSKRENFQTNIQNEFLFLLSAVNDKSGTHTPPIQIIALNLIQIHPILETIPAFRDVVSAQQDRETKTLSALNFLISTVLRSRGEATVEVKTAQGIAYSEQRRAEGNAIDLIARAEVVQKDRDLLEELLWIQASESSLSKRQLYLLPPGTPPQGFNLWQSTENIRDNASEKKQQEHKTSKQKDENKISEQKEDKESANKKDPNEEHKKTTSL